MTFVILGTQDKHFDRLLKAIDKQIEKGNLKGEVIVQAGTTNYKSENMKIFDMIPIRNFNKLLKEADLVITHGGVGTILSTLKYEKKIIAVPRLKKYGEHENDHQIQIVEEFTKLGYILSSKGLNNLDKKLEEVKEFKPKQYISNNNKMIKLIENFIDNI